jgi:ribosomal protein S25
VVSDYIRTETTGGDMNRKLITVRQLQDWLKISRSLAYKIIREDKTIEVVRVRGMVRIYQDSVEKLLQED